MKPVQQVLIGAVLTFALRDATADIVPGEPPELSAENVAAFFDAALSTQHQDHEIVGAIVAVVKDGELLFKRGYGFADLETRTASDADDSLFRIASISKTFVWTAMMQLHEAGSLDFDAEVAQYVDLDIPATYDEPIRVWHLMTHTAGFEERAIGMSTRDVDSLLPLREYLVEHMPARVRPPGLQAAYSNYSSAMAGYIVERTSGVPWDDYIDANILAPLGMTSTVTHAVVPPELLERHAASYSYRGGRFVREDLQYMMGTPAGIMSTTADDMARYMIAHLNGGSYDGAQILSAASVRKLHSPLFAPVAGLPPLLHGFFGGRHNGQFVVGHAGDINQFHSTLRLLPERNLGIFVSFNSEPALSARTRLYQAFLDYFFPAAYLAVQAPASDVDLDDFTGEYVRLRTNRSGIERLGILINNLTVSVSDEELAMKEGAGVRRFVPAGPDRFLQKYEDRVAVFQRGGDGQVTHLLIGTPMGSLERVHGLDAPGNIRLLMLAMVAIAAAALLGYGSTAIAWVAGRAAVLPRLDTSVGWLFALLVCALYVHLAVIMSGDTNEFQFGVPTAAHVNLTLMNVNLLLAIVVVALSLRQWIAGLGTLAARVRYSVLAIAAAISLWLGYYFNFATYILR